MILSDLFSAFICGFHLPLWKTDKLVKLQAEKWKVGESRYNVASIRIQGGDIQYPSKPKS
jgi:hypothetical protein